MQFNQLVKYLNQLNQGDSFDPFWNQVLLFHRFSADLSANEVLKGLPLHSDYSKYQRRTVKHLSTDSRADISYGNETPIPSQSDVTSYLSFTNRIVRSQRIAELNSDVNQQFSNVRACYLATLPGKARDFQLGTSDFTIDVTFKIDEVTPFLLGERIQCIFSVGENLGQGFVPSVENRVKTFFTLGTVGYGLYIQNTDLFFVHNGTTFKLNNLPLATNTWYSYAIQRRGNLLQSYLDGSFQIEYAFNGDVVLSTNSDKQVLSASSEVDTFLKQVHIGADPVIRTTNFFTYVDNTVDTCFSGSISNFRITEAARYLSPNYTVRLPYYNALRENALDSDYLDTVYNAPFTYDLFDYSKNAKHFSNREFLYSPAINLRTGGYILDGSGVQSTVVIPEELNDEEWTLEFYLIPAVNDSTTIPYYTGTTPFSFNTIAEFLNGYNVFYSYQQNYFNLQHGLLQITDEEDNAILELFSNIHHLGTPILRNSSSHHLSLKLSNDGINYITFGSETGIDLANSAFSLFYQQSLTPTNEITFAYSNYQSNTYIPPQLATYDTFIRGEYEGMLHIAVQKYLNNIYFFVNGELNKTVFFNGTIHSGSGLKVKVNDNFEELVGTLNGQASRVQFAIQGLRVTNKARYVANQVNNVWDLHSLHPLRLAEDKITPPRARIVDIVRKNISEIVSLDEVEWYIFLSVPVDNLTVDDFTLTQIEGIQGASIISLTKTTEYEYILKASTGTGNGRLTLNFVDDNTVTYKSTNIPIGNFLGELSFEGDTYRVNKSAPQPILTSGSSPYVNGPFRVEIKFDSALAQFFPEKIGIVNGYISNIKIIDPILKIYDFLVTPIKEDPIIIQALAGTAVTDNGLLSLTSEPFVRIFNKSFPILQLPLNIPSFTNDLSPSRLVLDQLIPNSLVHSTTIAPVGAGSSMHVLPFQEQSGLTLPSYKAIDTNFTTYSATDWTVEWFYRGDTTSNKTTHLFTVQNQASGFSVVMVNGRLKVQRSMEAPTDLFPTLIVNEKVTTNFVAWDNVNFTNLEKYPHFAISKKDDVYRFYVNGNRQAIIQSDININITTGNLFVGYYPNRINDAEYYLSNVRFTYGKALYTSATVPVPFIPYPILPDITEEASLLSYISIYSNNEISNLARTGDKIILYFSAIASLTGSPVVTINGITAGLIEEDYNSYKASIDVTDSLNDGQVTFQITIPAQPGIPSTSFSSVTNGTFVVIDNEPITSTFSTENPNDDRPVVEVKVDFNESPANLTKESFTVSNCYITDFYLDARNRFCTFKLNALSTGTISARLLSGSYTDLAGNDNQASTIFSREVVVPALFPDAEFSSVICLIQPTNSIIQDLSSNSAIVTANNLSVTGDTSPAGLSNSIYFNGINSSLDIDLKQTINQGTPYTIEMFTYMPTGTLFKLERPVANPASQVSSHSFTANWSIVDGATNYVVDVAPNPIFNNFLPGFQHREVTSTSLTVGSSTFNSPSPNSLYSNWVGNEGFVTRWRPNQYLSKDIFIEGYQLEVSLTEDFTYKLAAYSNSFTEKNFKVIGKNKNLQYIDEVTQQENEEESIPVFNNQQGVLLTSLFSDDNYPKLFYTLEESSIRYYSQDGYVLPAVAEDIDLFTWNHIAIVNIGKYTYLYVNGELQDRTRSGSYSQNVSSGYSIGGFKGYITGLRITKGYPRYTGNTYNVPTLPFYYT